MLETYLPCSERNVLAFISPAVLRANSRMTVARNRTFREERGLSGIYSPSYVGASQARTRSRRYKSRSRAFSLPFEGGEKVPRIFWISSDAKGTVSRNDDARPREEEGVTWRAAGYCVPESVAFPLRNSYVQSVEIYSGDGDFFSFHLSPFHLSQEDRETRDARADYRRPRGERP